MTQLAPYTRDTPGKVASGMYHQNTLKSEIQMTKQHQLLLDANHGHRILAAETPLVPAADAFLHFDTRRDVQRVGRVSASCRHCCWSRRYRSFDYKMSCAFSKKNPRPGSRGRKPLVKGDERETAIDYKVWPAMACRLLQFLTGRTSHFRHVAQVCGSAGTGLPDSGLY